MVNDTFGQWRLRPDNYQLDTFFLSYFSQSLYITRANTKVVGNLSRAGIAQGDINLLNFRALG